MPLCSRGSVAAIPAKRSPGRVAALRSRIPSAVAALRLSTHDSTVARSAPSSAAACSVGASSDSARSVQWSPPPARGAVAPRGAGSCRAHEAPGHEQRVVPRSTALHRRPAHAPHTPRCVDGAAGVIEQARSDRRPRRRRGPQHVGFGGRRHHRTAARRARWGPRSTTSCPTAAVRARARPVRNPPTLDRPIPHPGTHPPVQHRQWREWSPTPRRRDPFRHRRAWHGLRL